MVATDDLAPASAQSANMAQMRSRIDFELVGLCADIGRGMQRFGAHGAGFAHTLDQAAALVRKGGARLRFKLAAKPRRKNEDRIS